LHFMRMIKNTYILYFYKLCEKSTKVKFIDDLISFLRKGFLFKIKTLTLIYYIL